MSVLRKQSYDVIIAGGGPAGLLLARRLAKEFRVLVLEKRRIGDSNKSWVTYQDRWRKEGFPTSYIGNTFDTWWLRAHAGGKTATLTIKDRFLSFDEHKLLGFLAEETRRAGGEIKEKTPFKAYKKERDGLLINNKYLCRLLVDCTGISSPIVKKERLIELPVYINCYAYLAKFKSVKNKNTYEFYHEDGRFASFGVTKTKPGEALLLYYNYTNRELDINGYKKAMQRAVKRFGVPPHKIKELKIARYPTGSIKRRSLDRVFLFGDAGFYSPSINGMGFNEVLRQHHHVAQHLMSCLKRDLLRAQELELPKDIADDVNNKFFLLFGLIINDLPATLVRDMVRVMGSLPKRDLKRIMRNDVTDGEVGEILKKMLEKANIESLIKSCTKHHVEILVENVSALGLDIFTEEIHNLIFKHHKIIIKDMY